MPQKQSTITEIYSRHYGHNRYRSLYRKPFAECAYMTLWAKTELEDEVWLQTVRGLTNATIDSKVKKYEQANEHLLGKTIVYNYKPARGIGFLRSLEDNLQVIDSWDNSGGD